MNNKFETFVGCCTEAFEKIASSMLDIQIKESFIDNVSRQKMKTIVVISIVGVHKGRIILAVDNATSSKIGTIINCDVLLDNYEMFLCFSEFANIFAGKGISNINNMYKGLDLRLTPPAIFEGENLEIMTPAINTKKFLYDTELGQILIDIGFEGVA